MRIAMISEHASPLAPLGGPDAGGQNLHVAELAAALTRAGHAVTVYTRRDDPAEPHRELAPAGYGVVRVPAGPAVRIPKDELLPYMDRFGRWVARDFAGPVGSPDVLHAHFWMSGVAARRATALHRVPLVITFHALGVVKRRYQAGEDTSPSARIGIEAGLGRSAERVIAQCSDEVRELAGMGVPRRNIAVVPSGVDCDRFRPTGPAVERSGRHRVLTIGRLVARKGFEDLIRAIREVAVQGVDAELIVVGGPPEGVESDPEGRRLADLARQLGVSDRVRLVGAVPPEEMPAWYRSADVVACAPWYEPFGLTPLEAMACGVPVVAYAVGGLTDTVVEGVTGRHVAPRDIDGLAAVLRDLLADPAARERYGRAAAERAHERYTWATTAQRLTDVYADAISPRPATVVSGRFG